MCHETETQNGVTNFHPDIQEDLIFIQGQWQETGQYKDDENAHAQRNSFFNLVANGKPPAVLKNVQFPLERGMTMPSSVATAFMSSLTIGEDIKLPPSGFSYNPLIARSFADNAVDDKVAVLVRLAPNRSAEVYGIDLSCVDVPKEMEDAESHQSEINSLVRRRRGYSYSRSQGSLHLDSEIDPRSAHWIRFQNQSRVRHRTGRTRI
jgi:hypothetical protein